MLRLHLASISSMMAMCTSVENAVDQGTAVVEVQELMDRSNGEVRLEYLTV